MTAATHDVVAFEEARAIRRRRRTRVGLPIAVILIMLAALIGIAIYEYKTMRADALALSKGVIVNLQNRIESQVSAYLSPIPRIINISLDLLTDSKLAGVRYDLLQPLGIGVLNNVPQLSSLIIGSARGEFFMVRRFHDGETSGLETKIIKRPEGVNEPQVRLIRRGPQGETLSDTQVPWDSYDPRARPWYQGAAAAQGMFWTDVYPFFTDKAAGITGSQPYRDASGELVAVLGVDVKLESMSRFLRDLVIGKTGIALIVDDDGRVIAHPRAKLATEDADGKVQLTRVADLGDPVVSRAFDRYRVEGHGRRDFELSGRRYISSVSSLDHLLERHWSVLVVVPEDDFIAFVVENIGKTLGMGLGVLALAALLAGLLIRQGLRADRDALRILERQAQLDAQSEAFGELAERSTSLDAAQTDAMAPVTEAVARASRVRRASLWHLMPGDGQLFCVDCFDQETEGHTSGAILRRAEHPGLFEQLDSRAPFGSIDASHDEQLVSLHHSYLSPLGCHALLSLPIIVHGEVTGAVWLEDRAKRSEWPKQVESFAHAIANLLAMHVASGHTVAVTSTRLPPVENTAGDSTVSQKRPVPEPSQVPGDIDPGLGARRAAAFMTKLAGHADVVGGAGAEVIDRLAIMSLRFTDATALAETLSGDSNDTVISYLIRELEGAAAEQGLGYLKFLTDQVVAAVDPNEDSVQGAQRLADFALAVQGICERLFVGQHGAMAFRIGMDIGPVIGSIVGTQRRAFNLWGEAAQQASSMADTSLAGAIQVTESVYQALNGRYLFQLRGHHYLEGVGEFSTYLLSGRL